MIGQLIAAFIAVFLFVIYYIVGSKPAKKSVSFAPTRDERVITKEGRIIDTVSKT